MVNLNDTTPLAPSGKTNIKWQQSGNDVSAYTDEIGTGTVTHTGSLTVDLPVLGNGTADVKIGTAAQLVPTLPADATKYLDGTGAFTTPAGAGTVTSSGPPTNHQLPVWTTGTNIKGITGGGGTVLQGVASADPSFTITPVLGIAGSSVGTLEFANATSGTVKLSPTTGALVSNVITLPAATGTAVVASTSTTTTQALFATSTAGAPAYRAIAAGDLPLGSSSAFGAVKVDNTTITATAGVISAAGGGGSLVLLEQHTASTSASLDFTTAISSTYDTYLIELINVAPDTGSVNLYFRCNTGGGFDSGSNYIWTNYRWNSSGAAKDNDSGSATAIVVNSPTDPLTTTANALGVCGHLTFYNPASSVFKKLVGSLAVFCTGGFEGLSSIGSYQITTAVTQFQFLMSSGNIASGTIRVYGYTK